MNPISALKAVTNIFVSVGVAAIVKNAVKATTPFDYSPKLYKKVGITVATFVISSMISDAATTHVEATIDEAVESIKGINVATKELNDIVKESFAASAANQPKNPTVN